MERVTEASAAEWVEFMERVYSLDTGPWLPRLIGRPGWHQYVVREAGEIVAARGMHIGSDGIAWLGMDGPVPGVTTKRLRARRGPLRIHRLRRSRSAARARSSPTSRRRQTNRRRPPIESFGQLGFTRPYVRTHWTRR